MPAFERQKRRQSVKGADAAPAHAKAPFWRGALQLSGSSLGGCKTDTAFYLYACWIQIGLDAAALGSSQADFSFLGGKPHGKSV